MSRTVLSFRRWLMEAGEMGGMLAGAWNDSDPAMVMGVLGDWLEDEGDTETLEVIRRAAGASQKGARGQDDASVRFNMQKLQGAINLDGWETQGYRYTSSPTLILERDFVRKAQRGHLVIHADLEKRKTYMQGRVFNGNEYILYDAVGGEVARTPFRGRYPAEGEGVTADTMMFFAPFSQAASRQLPMGTPPEEASRHRAQTFNSLMARTEVPFDRLPPAVQKYLVLDLVPLVFDRVRQMKSGGHAPGNHVYTYDVQSNGSGQAVPVGWRYDNSYDSDAKGRYAASVRMDGLMWHSYTILRDSNGEDMPTHVAAVLLRSPGAGKRCTVARLSWLHYSRGRTSQASRQTKGAKADVGDFNLATNDIRACGPVLAGAIGPDFCLASDPQAVAKLVGLAKTK